MSRTCTVVDKRTGDTIAWIEGGVPRRGDRIEIQRTREEGGSTFTNYRVVDLHWRALGWEDEIPSNKGGPFVSVQPEEDDNRLLPIRTGWTSKLKDEIASEILAYITNTPREVDDISVGGLAVNILAKVARALERNGAR